jgi:hypothetical protein
MVPERYFHVSGDIFKKTELTLMRSVNAITDATSDAITVYARFLEPPATEPPTIIGKSGSTHGASTVSIPAANEIVKNKSI